MIRALARRGLDLVRSLRSRLVNPFDPPVVVLIYHRVTRLAQDPQFLAVTPENFRAQMRYLRAHFPVLRFDADWGKVTRPSVVVTFDDGYADNYLEALPVLEQEQVPATFFVSTGLLGSDQELWWDDLERLFLTGGELPARLSLELGGGMRQWPTASQPERLRCYQELHPLLRPLAPAPRDALLEAVRRWAGRGREGRASHRTLTPEQLRALAASPWACVGGHCVSHPRLVALAPEEQRREILDSRRQLEELTGRPVRVFSYPFGCRGDYDRAALAICRQAGFARVAANYPGQVHSWSDPMQLPRQLVRDWPPERFARELERFFRI